LHYKLGFEFSLYLNQLLKPMLKFIIYRIDKVYYNCKPYLKNQMMKKLLIELESSFVWYKYGVQVRNILIKTALFAYGKNSVQHI